MYTFSKKKICISFDWHNDRRYRHLLSAWIKNLKSPIDFEDLTPKEIDTSDISRVKAVLTTKIREATHTLVLVGQYANTRHEDSIEIGTRNWIWWEIEKSKAEENRLIAVKIESVNPTPDPLYNSGAKWAMSFTETAIVKAINES